MIVDEVRIKVKAGNGGAGKVAFNTVPKMLGPTGGNGGRGGDLYVEGVSDLSALRQFRFKKDFKAGNGAPGQAANRTGLDGVDLILKVPIGTVVHMVSDSSVRQRPDANHIIHTSLTGSVEVTKVGEKIMIAKGGKGGRGNFEFRSSTYMSPTYAQPGLPGEEYEIFLELRLIADAGLIGLPNAGKSSLLNELTKANVKVANYPFTTLEPNLGQYKNIILADIPGLIEGASGGKGLGTRFLRHIARTKILLHCLAADSADIMSDYKTVRAELEAHDAELAKKDEYILLTKSDTVDAATLKKQLTAVKKLKKPVTVVSIHNSDQLADLKKLLDKIA